MGIANINKSDGLTLETEHTVTDSIAFEEKGDIERQNLEKQSLISFILGLYEKAKDARLIDEQRWLEAYNNFRGIYSADVQFTDTEKSQAFIKITKTKVLAACAQVEEILYSGGKFPIAVEATPVPEGVLEKVNIDPKKPQMPQGPSGGPQVSSTIARPEIIQFLGSLKDRLLGTGVQGDALQEGAGDTPTALTWEPAKESAKKLDKLIQDQLSEANAPKSLRGFCFDLTLFGTGVYKGPTVLDKEYPRWGKDGSYEPVIKQIPDFEHVSIWDSYPDPEARAAEGEMEFFIQRHRFNRTQLRQLKKRPYFREKSIEQAIKMGPDYKEEYWENTLRDDKTQPITQRYEVLEYWGLVDSDIAEVAELKIPEKFKGLDQIQMNVWVCNGQILRLVFNPFTPARIPYFLCPYELNPYSIFGIGVAENMADSQLLMNGFMRMAVDNAVLSSNLIFEIDETNMVPGQDLKVYPGKIFRRQGGQPGASVFATKFPNVTQECMMMFDKARQLADESTGMPSYAHGISGIQSVNRTAAGMSMLMGAAAQSIKQVIRNIDDYLLVPLGKAIFAFNMQFNFNEDFVGDLEILAKGTESLMRNEIRSQKILQFLQLTNNPVDAPWVKRDYLLRELAEDLDIDPEMAVNDPRMAGLQAMIMQQMMAATGVGSPGQPQGEEGAGNPASVPSAGQTAGGGSGNISPGSAPEPGAQGYSGGGSRTNGPSRPNDQ